MELEHQGTPEENYALGLNFRLGINNTPINLKKSFYHCKLAADAGLPKAKREVGIHYKWGLGVEQSYEKAISFFHEAIDNGDDASLIELGECCEKGLGVVKDLELAFDYYQFAADQGVSSAIEHLDILAECRLDKFKDEQEIFEQYQKAAAEGSEFALWMLGRCYERGIGVAQSFEESAFYFRLLENRTAFLHLGIFNEFGLIKDSSLQLAFENYLKASSLHDVQGLSHCGRFLSLGIHGTKEAVQALEYYIQAAKLEIEQEAEFRKFQGVIKNEQRVDENFLSLLKEGRKELELLFKCEPEGQKVDFLEPSLEKQSLALTYWKMLQQVPPSQKKLAFHYCKNAAEYGYIPALVDLAEKYKTGSGTPISIENALKFYNIAAKNQNGKAYWALGQCYENGIGVEKSDEDALLYYISAYKNHSCLGASALSNFFLEGRVVRQSDKVALFLAWRAFELSDGFLGLGLCHYLTDHLSENFASLELLARVLLETEFYYNCGVFFELGIGIEKSLKEAFKYYEKAAHSDQDGAVIRAKALRSLGRFYIEGFVVEKSIEKALAYFDEAAIIDIGRDLNILFK